MKIHRLISNGVTASTASENGSVLDFTGTAEQLIRYQATGQTTSGSGACVVTIQVSNDNTNWLALGTISLTLGVTTTTDGYAASSWPYMRGYMTSISGTGASVTVTASF